MARVEDIVRFYINECYQLSGHGTMMIQSHDHEVGLLQQYKSKMSAKQKTSSSKTFRRLKYL
jgi:hypothetical protein